MFLGNVENGEVVVAFNPMWAERFGAAFPDVDDLTAYLREQRVAADRPLARRRTPSCCATAAASTADGRVHLVERPDQIVPIVCGGLGSLHAIALPSFGESTMQSKPVVRAADDDGSRCVSPRQSTSSRGFLRADGADLLLLDANPKTARIHLRARARRRLVRRLHPPARRCSATRSQQSLQRRDRRRVRARARRSAPRVARQIRVAELERARRASTNRCCTTSCAALDDEAGMDSGVFSALAYLERAEPPHRMPMSELQRADASALQPARLQPAGAADGGRRARRASIAIPTTAAPRS